MGLSAIALRQWKTRQGAGLCADAGDRTSAKREKNNQSYAKKK